MVNTNYNLKGICFELNTGKQYSWEGTFNVRAEFEYLGIMWVIHYKYGKTYGRYTVSEKSTMANAVKNEFYPNKEEAVEALKASLKKHGCYKKEDVLNFISKYRSLWLRELYPVWLL